MNNEWQQFLAEQGARFDDSKGIVDFGDRQAELAAASSDDILCDLSHFGLIRASGEESSTFLQGQFSNDVRQVTSDHHQLSSYCSPKGRMLALFRLFQRDEAYYLSLPQALLEPTLKRLRMFVLMSKVSLEDAGEQLVRFGLSGPNAEYLLQQHFTPLPAGGDAVLTRERITLLRLPGPQPRFELHGPLPEMKALWQSLSGRVRKGGADCWELLDIQAGLPAVYPETTEAFVPQMVNLQLVNGVSFKKGCYTGQEIVARMQYLGKLKRRMYRARVDTATRPNPGDELTSPHSASGQGAGKVVRAAPSAEGGYELLCVIEIVAAESGELHLADGAATELQLLPLPYPFEQAEKTPQAAG
jgi:tRNA-modifying protein YgfZ